MEMKPYAPTYKFTFKIGVSNFELFEIDYTRAAEKLGRIIQYTGLEDEKPILLKVVETNQ